VRKRMEVVLFHLSLCPHVQTSLLTGTFSVRIPSFNDKFFRPTYITAQNKIRHLSIDFSVLARPLPSPLRVFASYEFELTLQTGKENS
jgi:ABC-type uncharacterized transport system permease subunit